MLPAFVLQGRLAQNAPHPLATVPTRPCSTLLPLRPQSLLWKPLSKPTCLNCSTLQVELLKAAGAAPAPEAGEEVTAPCHQNILASWFFGTTCDLPTFDDALKDPSKYKQPKAQAAGGPGDRRRSRSLLAAAMQRLW
jgi:hypothetical protein